ncbi:MAG: M23 family metallopeptidase, partial [Deinococcales bacterium]
TLAARVGLSASALAKLNQLPVDATLKPGQSLLLPADAPIQAGAGGAAGPTGPTEPEPADRGAAGVGVRRAASRPPVEAALSARQRLRGMQDDGLRAAVALLPKVSFTTGTFMAPVQGRVSSRFGWRALSVNGNHYHAGVDLAAPMGTPVHAARDGVVVKAGWGGTYGNVVFLDHGDGTQTRYAHLSRIDVRVGEGVRQGDVLGLVGSTGASTGPHVHFELRFDGRAVDPLAYLHGLATR